MPDDDRSGWDRLPKVNLDSRVVAKRIRKAENATIRHAHKFVVKRWGSVRDVQRHVVLWVSAMSILIAVTGLQLMWFQQSYKKLAPTNDGTYAEATLGPVDTLNPLFSSSSAEQSASRLMFSSILQYDRTGNLSYDLATGIRVSGDNKIYTVSIRPDVKWHDGKSLTANDIAFTVGLMQNPIVRSTIRGWGDISVKVIDNTTIEFTLKSTYAAFQHALTFPIVPEHILGKITPSKILENNFSKNPIGSGPFKMQFIQKIDTKSSREVVYMTRNEDYYGGIAKLARFQLHAYDSSDEIIDALSNNGVNAATDLSITDIEHVDSKKYVISVKPIQSGVYAIINTKSESLKDVALRRALQMATSTKAIRDKLPSGTLALELPFTNGQLTGDVPKVAQYDLTGAKNILDANGWVLNSRGVREKEGKVLKISVVTMRDGGLERTLETLAGQWRALGISVNTQVVDPTLVSRDVVQSILQPRNYDVLIYQLNIGADPDVYAYWHSSQASLTGFNLANYTNPISDDALSSARTRVESELRNAKYITFTRQWLADIPAIGLYQSTAQYIRSVNVKSFDKSNVFVSPYDRYSDVLDWSVGTRWVYKTP
jgi:peptide/nickel transport system substrate-binding protein